MQRFCPLEGVRVVEVTGEMGVLTGRLLADLGAEVIRVESPDGDAVRRRPPFAEQGPELERSLAHQHYNAGKRSVACALETPEGREQLSALLDEADLFVLEEPLAVQHSLLGAWYAGLSKDLVRVLIRGFPVDSPRSGAPVTDLVGLAAGGELNLCGFPDRSPAYPGGQLAYGMVSSMAAAGALAGLLHHSRGGRGREISLSMQEAVNLITTEQASVNYWLVRKEISVRHGKFHPLFGGTFQAGDGRWLVFNFIDFNPLAEWLTEEGLFEFGPEWQDFEYRLSHTTQEVEPLIQELCRRYPAEKLIAEAQRRGMYHMAINEVDDVLEHPLLQEREFFFEMPRAELGVSLPLQRLPYRTTRGIARPTSGAPKLGADTQSLLSSAKRNRSGRGAAKPAGRAAAGSTALLRGVRVVEICSAIAGPLATRVFATLGAEVIKIETEARPDLSRGLGFSLMDAAKTLDSGPCYNDINSCKHSVKLNLKSPRGIELVKELVAHSDVLMDNFGNAGTMEKFGLGFDALRAVKPDLISISSSTVGENKASLGFRSFGTGITAAGGLNTISGTEGEAPIGLGVAHSDYTGPYVAATTLLAALYERDRTGEGIHIDMSQLEGAVWLLDTKPMEYAVTRERPARLDNHSLGMAPHDVYRCSGDDRWCAISVADDAQWQKLCMAIDRKDLAGDASLASFAGRKAAEARLDEILSDWCAGRDVWEAANLLSAAGVAAAPVETNRDFAENDAGMRGFYEDLEHPDGVTLRVMGDPLHVDSQRPPIRLGPRLGEHNQRFLGDLLGYTPEQIAQLEADGVVR